MYNNYESVLNIIISYFESVGKRKAEEIEFAYGNNTLFLIVSGNTIRVCIIKNRGTDNGVCTEFLISDNPPIAFYISSKITPMMEIEQTKIYPLSGVKISDTLELKCTLRFSVCLKVFNALVPIKTFGSYSIGRKKMLNEFVETFKNIKISEESYYEYMMLQHHSNGTFDVLLKDYRRRFDLSSDAAAAISLERQLRRKI